MSTYNFLDKTGLGLVWAKIKALIPTKTSDLTNDSDFVTFDDKASTSAYGVTKLSSTYNTTNSELAATQTAVYGVSNKAIWTGTCTTSPSTQVKEVTLATNQAPNFPSSLISGMNLRVYFSSSSGNTNTQPYIQLKKGTQAFTAYPISPSTMASNIKPDSFMDFTFYGNYWYMVIPGGASTTNYGLTTLSTSVSSTSTSSAATPSAVKQAYDLANGRVPSTRTVNGKALSSDITLTASDVGALSDDTEIPTATSDLTNDSGFITSSDVPKEVMVVTITRNGSTLISNKTYSEMASVLDGGGIVICQLGISFYNLSYYNDNVYMRFAHTEIYEDEGDYYAETEYLMIMHTGVITYSKESYTVSLALLPDTIIINPTNGQYLKYDGSVWRNSAPPTDTTYSLSMSGNRITLTPSSGTASYIDLPVYNGGVRS